MIQRCIQILCVGVLLLLAPACSKDNPGRCVDGDTDPACTDQTGPGCSTPDDCAEVLGKTVCDVGGTDACVQCTPTMAAACTGTTPVCSGVACRACSAHSECPRSDACLPDGSCAAEAAVVYLKEGGSGTVCSKAMPCGIGKDAITAVSAARPYIRVLGAVNNGDMSIDGGNVAQKNVTLLGDNDGNSVLKREEPEKNILDIKNATNVRVFDLQLTEATEAGVKVDGGAVVALYRSKILRSMNEGIQIVNGNVSVSQSEISGSISPRYGIDLGDGELTLSRSTVSNNAGGGIFIKDNRKFTITNSFIVGNKVGGGINARNPATGSNLSFSTIVDNVNTGNGGSSVGGVSCDNNALVFPGNIIFRNVPGPGATGKQTDGGCTYGSSFVNNGSGPADTTLAFEKDDVDPRNYHLTAASPASVRDVSTAVCDGLVDYDGEARPQGGACDLGADEYKAP